MKYSTFKAPADFERRVREIYEPGHPGGTDFPGFLLESDRKHLVSEARKAKYGVIDESGGAGVASRRNGYSRVLYWRVPLSFAYFAGRYGEFMRERLGDVFPNTEIDTITLNYYPRGSWMARHRDGKNRMDLHGPVSIFVLEGDEPLQVGEGSGRVELSCYPGSLLVLRTPRSEEEGDTRPWHWVRKVKRVRRTLVLGQYRK